MKHLLRLILALLPLAAHAQQVGVNTATPHPSAALEVNSDQRGFLPPRLTTAQRDAIAGPSRGLVVYNLDTDCLEFWNGTQWISTCTSVPPCSPPPASTPASNSPVCSGTTLNLTATPVGGATYVWNGPNGFTSTTQNPSLSNATVAMSGVYTLRTWALGCYSAPVSTTVTVLPNPWTLRGTFTGTKRSDPVIFGVGGLIYVGAGYNGAHFNDFYAFDPGTGTFTPRTAVPGGGRYSRTSWATATLGYCTGGFNGGTTYQDTYRYTPGTDTWTTVAACPSTIVHANNQQSNPGAGVGYVAGGKYASCGTCGCYSNNVYRYNEGANTWTTFAWPQARRAVNVTVPYNGLLYIGCGQSWDSCPANYSDFFSLDPATGTTTNLAAYPGSTGGKAGYFELGGYIYVIDQTRTVYRYNPAANTWSTLPCLAPVSGYTVVTNGRAFIVDMATTGQVWEFLP